MSAPTKPPGPLHKAARVGGTFASLALAPLLATQLGLLWLLHDGAEIVLPDSAQNLVREKLTQAGIACTWSRASVSLSGRIELTDARVGAAGGGDPVFEAGRLVAVLDMFDLISQGRVTPRRLWLDRGRLLCPAVLSPTGKTEVALDSIRAAFSREGERLVVETLQARCAGVPLAAHGALLPPRFDPGKSRRSGGLAGAPGHGAPLLAPAQAAARLVALRPWLERLEGASLELHGEGVSDGVKLSLDGLADAIRFPGSDVEQVRLHAEASWDAAGLRPEGPARFSVASLSVERPSKEAMPAISARCDRVDIATRLGADWTAPTSAQVSALHPVVNGLPLDRLALSFDWASNPTLRIAADAIWHRERVAAKINLNIETGESDIAFDAHLRPSELRRHPAYPTNLPEEAAAFRVTGFADLAGSVRLGRDYAFEKAKVRLEAGQTKYFAIDVPSFRAAVEVTPDKLIAYDIDALSPEQRVQGAFETGFHANSPYRLLLRGQAYPEQVEPFVGQWWKKVWRDLAVTPGHPVHADIEVAGQWDGLPHEFIFAAIHARKLAYRKQVFDRAALSLLELPNRLLVHDIVLTNPDGTRAGGRLDWVYKIPEHRLDSVRFLFNGRLPLRVAAELGGDDVVEALAEVTLNEPADATVLGRYHGPASPTPARDQLEVRVRSRGAFNAWGIPGEDFSGTVVLDNRRIQIKGAKLRYAGGDATGDAWLLRRPEGYRLTFDATVAGCERSAFFAGLSGLKKPAAGEAPESAKTKAAEPSAADLSGHIRARIALPEIATLDGAGSFVMNDAALFKLPLFGVFTDGLANIGVNVGNYTFDKADGEFVIRNGSVWFPELTVRGPEAQVDLRGDCAITSGALNFRAVLNPKSPDKIPFLDSVRAFVNRGTRLFPVDIRGTLDSPEWAVAPTPGALFKAQQVDSLGLPPPPPADDGGW